MIIGGHKSNFEQHHAQIANLDLKKVNTFYENVNLKSFDDESMV